MNVNTLSSCSFLRRVEHRRRQLLEDLFFFVDRTYKDFIGGTGVVGDSKRVLLFNLFTPLPTSLVYF